MVRGGRRHGDEDILADQGLCASNDTPISDRIRYLVEFFGTFIMTFCGFAGSAVYFFSDSQQSDALLAAHLNWGFSVSLAVYVSSAVSGGHLNPAVTLAFCLNRRFEWSKLPGYFLAQTLGSALGAVLVYALYHSSIQQWNEGHPDASLIQGTVTIFNCFPLAGVSTLGVIIDQIWGTAFLLFAIFAAIDPRNHVPRDAQPAIMGLIVTLVQFSINYNCGSPINPARDLGPRIFTAFIWGKDVFTAGNYFWLVSFFCPFLGGPLGAILYRLLVNPD